MIIEDIPKITTLYPGGFRVTNVTLGGEIKEKGNAKIIKKEFVGQLMEILQLKTITIKKIKLTVRDSFTLL